MSIRELLGGLCFLALNYTACKSTWSYENRVGKHLCNFSQLPLSNSLFTVLFADVGFFLLVLYVVRDLHGVEVEVSMQTQNLRLLV